MWRSLAIPCVFRASPPTHSEGIRPRWRWMLPKEPWRRGIAQSNRAMLYLGFRESVKEDGLDILITAIFQEDIGGKLGSRVLAEGVIFEDWETFQEWFDSQGTGWRIKSALDIESTCGTKTEDSGLCKTSP